MTMIPDSAAPAQDPEPGWQALLRQGLRSVDELLSFCELEPADFDPALAPDPGSAFALRVTRHYASLIEKGNPRDPLLLQVLPLEQESRSVAGYGLDPVGDRAAEVAPGLIHKYPGRALLTLTGACAIHCRYCFRRHFPYAESRPELDDAVLDYLRQRADIHELILSGGDPLMWNDERLRELVRQLAPLPQLRLLRIHSRMAAVLPQRIDDGLLDALDAFHGQVLMVHHINHPREIEPGNARAFARLQAAGIRQFNQSVLLRDVNDDAGILAALSFKLFEHGIQPYYLHRLDRVQGAAHFDLPETRACRLHRELRERLPGYLLPRLVNEIPGKKSKSPAHCR